MTDAFTPDKRRAMTPARKRRIWTAWDGKCWFCKMAVPVDGPQVEYDHVDPLWMKGSDADEDIGPIHTKPCHVIKTKADATKRAKTKRLIKTRTTAPEDRPPSTLQGRGFQTSHTRGFDGKVRPRKPRRSPRP